jgi:hypothetical protein
MTSGVQTLTPYVPPAPTGPIYIPVTIKAYSAKPFGPGLVPVSQTFAIPAGVTVQSLTFTPTNYPGNVFAWQPFTYAVSATQGVVYLTTYSAQSSFPGMTGIVKVN